MTTKSGSNLDEGKVQVEFSSFWKVAPKIDLDYYNPVASSAECIDYERRGFYNGTFFGQPFRPVSDYALSYGGSYSPAMMAMNEHRLGYVSDTELEAELTRLSKLDNRKQIKDNLLAHPFTQQYNLTVSSAGKKLNQSMSLLYEGSNRNWKGTDRDRYNFSYRINTKMYNWLSFNVGATFDYSESKNNSIQDFMSLSPSEMLLNEDGSYNMLDECYMPNIHRYFPYDSFPYKEWGYNPIIEMKAMDYKTTTLNYRLQGGLVLNLARGISIGSSLVYERINVDTKNLTKSFSSLVGSTLNSTSSWDMSTNKVTPNLPLGDFLDQNKSLVHYTNWRNQLTINRDFNALKHQVSFVAGTELSDRISEGTVFPRTYGYNSERLTVGKFPNGPGGVGVLSLKGMNGGPVSFDYTSSFTYNQERYFSLFANGSYTYNQRYTLSGSYRTDASNMITDDPKYRYAPFWSVGGSWNVTNEQFCKKAENWLNRLVVRLTYGYNGNVDRSTSFKPLISIDGTQDTYILGTIAKISSYGNPTLRWEKTGTMDLGMDYGLFNGKLFGKLDIYNKKGKDLIVATAMSSVNGTVSQKMNTAKMTNKGVEIELGTTLNIYHNDISFTGGINYSYNKNKITSLFKPTYDATELVSGGTSSYVKGHNSGTIWCYEYGGVKNKGTDENPNMQPMVKGANGELYGFNGWIFGDARDFILDMGTMVAPHIMGINGNFKLYGFNLSFIFTGKFGHKFRGYQFNYPSMMLGKALPNSLYKETLNSDPSKVVPIPFDKYEPSYYFWGRFYPCLNYRIQKAGHFRCQEVNVSYSVSDLFLRRIGMNGIRFFVQGNNLFTLVNNKYHEDPEHPKGTLKPQPTYTFGINLTL